LATVGTVLPPPERPGIDAAGDGCFDTLHADSLREALYVARRRRVDAMVISVHRCHGEALPGVARFVREFPAIPAVALVSRHDREATETLLRLGATGVRSAIDCTEPDRKSTRLNSSHGYISYAVFCLKKKKKNKKQHEEGKRPERDRISSLAPPKRIRRHSSQPGGSSAGDAGGASQSHADEHRLRQCG